MSLTLLANHDYSQCYVSSKNSLFLINSELLPIGQWAFDKSL